RDHAERHRGRHARADPGRPHPRRRARRDGREDGRRLLHARRGPRRRGAEEGEGAEPQGVSEADEARALRTPEAVRAAAERAYAYVERGESAVFVLAPEKLADVVARVVETTQEKYGGFDAVPYHARERHFLAGGVDRLAFLGRIADRDERFRASVELVVTS